MLKKITYNSFSRNRLSFIILNMKTLFVKNNFKRVNDVVDNILLYFEDITKITKWIYKIISLFTTTVYK